MMPDGNTAAERAYSAEQARSEARHDAYGDRVIESIVDDLFTVRGKVAGLTLHDFLDEIGSDDLAPILFATNGDEQLSRVRDLRTKVEQRIREWCGGRGSDEVDERVRSWEESDRADAAESRHAVAEAI